MSKFDFFEKLDYSKVDHSPLSDQVKEEKIYKKSFNCASCHLNYSFEYLIRDNSMNRICFSHLSPFDIKGGKWKCCGSSVRNNVGCTKHLHDIQYHYEQSRKLGIPYLVKASDLNQVIHGQVHDHYYFQIPLELWLRIIKKKYPRKENIPFQELDKTIHNVVTFKNQREFNDYFFKREKRKVHVNDREFTIVSSAETFDQVILYVEDENDMENKMDDEDEYNQDFVKYSLVRYFTLTD